MSIGLILTVGYSPEPLIFSIEEYAPEYVVFVGTSSSINKVIDRVVESTALRPSQYFKLEVTDHSEAIGEVCQKIQEAVKKLKDRNVEKIICDPTGGKKWMSAGAIMVASAANVEMIYVDAKYVDGKPSKDSMKIVPLGNAYDQTGFIYAERGIVAFNSYDFSGAAEYFRGITPVDSAKNDLFQGLSKICEVLAKWDRFVYYDEKVSEPYTELSFDLEKAFEQVNRALHNEHLKIHASNFCSYLDGISRIISFWKNIDGLERSQKLFVFVVDVFMNGKRRIKRRRFDDAVARFYRTLEAFGQYLLRDLYGIDSSNLTKDNLTESQLDAFLFLLGVEELPSKIDLVNVFLLLKVLENPIGEIVFKNPRAKTRKELYDSFSFRKLLSKRNESILAHGFVSVSEKDCNDFQSKLEELFHELEIVGGSFFDLSKSLEIPDMPEIGF